MRGAALLACLALYLSAAETGAKFEVASIRPSAPGRTFCGNTTSSSLQLTMQGCTVKDFVGIAWDVRSFALFLPPDQPWISSVRFDITAKSGGPVNPADQWHMLGPVLEDRFRLKWHREKRDLPVYYASVAKGGLKLPATKAGTCTAWDKKGPPPPPDPRNLPTCDYILFPGTQDGRGLGMDGTGVPMESLVAHLVTLLGRPVIDKTGFSGIFDVHLRFERDSSLALATRADVSGEAPSGLPSVFTAVRAAGLNIEAGKGPVDVFVVDSVQKPSEN